MGGTEDPTFVCVGYLSGGHAVIRNRARMRRGGECDVSSAGAGRRDMHMHAC